MFGRKTFLRSKETGISQDEIDDLKRQLKEANDRNDALYEELQATRRALGNVEFKYTAETGRRINAENERNIAVAEINRITTVLKTLCK